MRIAYRKGYKYQLANAVSVQTALRPEHHAEIPRAVISRREQGRVVAVAYSEAWVTLATNGMLYIAAGYAWDGATGALDFKRVRPATLVHDALYQLMSYGALPNTPMNKLAADLEFKRIMREDRFKLRHSYYGGMRVGSRLLGLPSKPKPIIEAP